MIKNLEQEIIETRELLPAAKKAIFNLSVNQTAVLIFYETLLNNPNYFLLNADAVNFMKVNIEMLIQCQASQELELNGIKIPKLIKIPRME
jgi:hypothetical protein